MGFWHFYANLPSIPMRKGQAVYFSTELKTWNIFCTEQCNSILGYQSLTCHIYTVYIYIYFLRNMI